MTTSGDATFKPMHTGTMHSSSNEGLNEITYRISVVDFFHTSPSMDFIWVNSSQGADE